MKTIKHVLITSLVLSAFSANATYLDIRAAYATQAKNWEHRARAGLDFAQDWQVHLEGTQTHGKNLFSDKDQTVAAFETEVNYNYATSNSLTWTPGFVYWSGKTHVEYRPYIKLSWAPSNYYINGRVRYQSATDNAVDPSQDTHDTTQLDAWFGYAFEVVSLEYNPAYIMRDNASYKSDGSYKDNKWEHTFQAKYTGYDMWAPYLEFQLLDNIQKDNGDIKEEMRWRFGVTWMF